MKKHILLISLILSFIAVQAQQTHQYTQYMSNQFGHNPAVAGGKPCTDLRSGVRQQWLGFEGAPLSMYFSASGRLKLENKTTQSGNHGVGIYMQRDDIGPTGKTSMSGAYAYHIPLTLTSRLGMGVSAGLQQFRFDANKVTLFQGGDDAIGASTSSMIFPDMGAGLWYYSKRTYAGIGVLQLIKRPFKAVGEDSKITPHFNITAGYSTSGNTMYSLIPSFMLKMTPLAPPSLDLNLMMDVKRAVAFGFSYRYTDAIAGIVKLRLLKYFDVGYSYDFITSKMRKGTSGSHEITLGFSSCGKKDSGKDSDICPAYR